tara:strand:- start:1581 stop:2423 length:843 start_codon:yes stop_codon:yes gene_type:complete
MIKVGQLVFIADQTLYPGKSEEILYELHVTTPMDTTNTASFIPEVKWENPDATDNNYTFFKLIHNEFLDNSNNSYKKSFLEVLDHYKDANLGSLLSLFDELTKRNEFFYKKLKEIESTIDLALTNSISTENNDFAKKDQYQGLIGLGITLEEYYQMKNFLTIYYESLHIIKQSVHIYKNFLVFQETNRKYKEAHDILYNNDVSLNAFFIKTMKSNVIEDLNVTTKLSVRPKMDPYIKEYVFTHGWPSDGVFDNDLMSNIIINKNSLHNFLPPWNSFPPPI